MFKKNTKTNIIIILILGIVIGIVIGIIIALIISHIFPTSVKSIINILKNDPVKLFSALPAHTVTIVFKLDYQKHRKKRKK